MLSAVQGGREEVLITRVAALRTSLERLRATPPVAYALLLAFYAASRLPGHFAITDSDYLIYPLEAVYITQHLVAGPEGGLDPALARVPISPANNLFIYPPGIYALSYFLGSIENMLLFLFLAQAALPLLLYRMFQAAASPPTAFLFAALLVFASTNSILWSPDTLAYPVMAAGLCLWWSGDESRLPGHGRVALLGLTAGITILIKHNVGVFFSIACGTLLMFRTMRSSPPASDPLPGGRVLPLLLAGFFSFGGVFFFRVLYWDEVVFYLAPYLAFWGCVAACVFSRRRPGFAAGRFFAAAAVFSAAALFLPALAFAWVGRSVGYERYLRALFGMGWEFLPIWDSGILHILKSLGPFGPAPFVVNCLAVGRLVHLMRTDAPSDGLIRHFEAASLGILGALMLFPLEARVILLTKVFLFMFVAAYFLERSTVPASWVRTALLAAVAAFGAKTAVRAARPAPPVSPGPAEVQRVVGLPLSAPLAGQFERQIEAVKRWTEGRPFFVLDASEQLTSLLALVPSRHRQHSLVMRRGVLTEEVRLAILTSLGEVDFVVVNGEAYDEFEAGRTADPAMASLLAYVRENFRPAARVDRPRDEPSLAHFADLVVMKRVPSRPR